MVPFSHKTQILTGIYTLTSNNEQTRILQKMWSQANIMLTLTPVARNTFGSLIDDCSNGLCLPLARSIAVVPHRCNKALKHHLISSSVFGKGAFRGILPYQQRDSASPSPSMWSPCISKSWRCSVPHALPTPTFGRSDASSSLALQHELKRATQYAWLL